MCKYERYVGVFEIGLPTLLYLGVKVFFFVLKLTHVEGCKKHGDIIKDDSIITSVIMLLVLRRDLNL